MEYNSFFSHAIDYQRKPFSAQVLLKGNTGLAKAKEVIAPTRESDPSALAETLSVRRVGADSGYEYLTADIGQTVLMLEKIKEGILEENPEASFYHELRSMSQLTGPAVERALGDAVNRANEARAEHDPQTIKLFQMAIAMCGSRLNTGDWIDTTKRDEVFRPFDLDSFKAGQLDMTILGRPVVPETEQERIDLIAQRESLQTRWGLEEIGIDPDVAQRIIREKQEAFSMVGDIASEEEVA